MHSATAKRVDYGKANWPCFIFRLPLGLVPCASERIWCAIQKNSQSTERRSNPASESCHCQWHRGAHGPHIFVPSHINQAPTAPEGTALIAFASVSEYLPVDPAKKGHFPVAFGAAA